MRLPQCLPRGGATDARQHGDTPTDFIHRHLQQQCPFLHVEGVALAGGARHDQASDARVQHEVDQLRQHFQRQRTIVVEWGHQWNDDTGKAAGLC